jgi:hypothetical protein
MIDYVLQSQSQKEATINQFFDAAEPAIFLGFRAETTGALQFGFYGGVYKNGSLTERIGNGTVALTASATNYVQFEPTTGVVSVSTSAFLTGKTPMYKVVTNATNISSIESHRILGSSGGSSFPENGFIAGGENNELTEKNQVIHGSYTKPRRANDFAFGVERLAVAGDSQRVENI